MVNPLNSKYNNQAPIPIGKGVPSNEKRTRNSKFEFKILELLFTALFKFRFTIQIRGYYSNSGYEQCPSTHREWLNHFTIQGKCSFQSQIFYARWMSERSICEYKYWYVAFAREYFIDSGWASEWLANINIYMSLSRLANLVLSEYAYADYF